MRSVLLASMLALVSLAGCYSFTFEQNPPTTTLTSTTAPVPRPKRFVTYVWTGTGPIDTRAACEHPVRTRVKVNPRDMFAAMFTLYTYRPYTLYVTCEQ